MLRVSSDLELEEICAEQGWEVEGKRVRFQRVTPELGVKDIPSLQVVSQTMSYAKELERIV